MHEDLGYISQNLLTKDAGQQNQALQLDVRDCALYVALLKYLPVHFLPRWLMVGSQFKGRMVK